MVPYDGAMSGMPLESQFANSPAAGVTDAAREAVSGRLNEAYQLGELELVDYQRLLDATFAATTNAELVPVAQALPARLSASEPVLGGDDYGPPGEVAPLNSLPEVRQAAGQLMTSRAWKLGVGAFGVVVVLIVLAVVLL